MITRLGCCAAVAFCALVLGGDAANAEQKFKIGVITPLSGFAAEYGTALKNGIEMARASAGIEHVAFRYEDSEYDQKKTISAYNKLRTADRANLIFNWGANPSEPLIPLAERHRFPLIAFTLDHNVTRGMRYTIRFSNANYEFARTAARELRRRNVKLIGILRADSNYLATLTDGLAAALGPEQTLEVVDVYQPADNDFRSSITKLKTKRYDIIGVFLSSGQISQFYRLCSEQAIAMPTLGTDFFESGTEIAAAGEAINGAFYAHNDVSEQFKRDYVARWGNDYQITTAGAGYDFAMMSGELFSSGDRGKPAEEILRIIKVRGSGGGVLGERKLRESPEEGASFGFPIVLKEIKNGKIVSLTPQ